MLSSITCTAPVNIATIKYWGKRDEKLILPLNSSLSGTLHQDDLKTTTTAVASENFTEDAIWLNGKKEDINTTRYQNVLRMIRSRATKLMDKKHFVHICSINNFPTAAGLASSASGYACLVYVLAQLYGVSGDISAIARIGSGSACRSVYGGFVKWEMGAESDGSDSIAVQVAPETHWPEMNIIVLVVNDKKKETSSTDGMQRSAATSPMMKERCATIVPQRMRDIEAAIQARDFQTFGDITMKDSDDFHEVCATTDPAIYYLNDTSRYIMNLVHKYNKMSGKIKCAYTFDAGPNACIYLPEENVVEALALFTKHFPGSDLSTYYRGSDKSNIEKIEHYQPPKNIQTLFAPEVTFADSLKYILHTKIGPGPQILDESESLIDKSTGLPKYVAADPSKINN
ncbi:diphosphomevalonate decarboxylase [Heterostelium album PN500]|uniref:Diphosphomevalonate decarboxylase n=1 Tax=Heterostelium pallidum (strain ATCC 26659 / Pp 5 / PN500) TaxID=670386 RepID=D3BVM9_HETP5|nr:diphosphomevalonate decarboxylase [Heterostelium album PN500]EFA74532.1 diphosphomevalonate decarboxylase [Heterostelium album PN500]|eukprot:XP_020426666.1 diphosphomevalonate decarboxylase [Heterostelium album PN500]